MMDSSDDPLEEIAPSAELLRLRPYFKLAVVSLFLAFYLEHRDIL